MVWDGVLMETENPKAREAGIWETGCSWSLYTLGMCTKVKSIIPGLLVPVLVPSPALPAYPLCVDHEHHGQAQRQHRDGHPLRPTFAAAHSTIAKIAATTTSIYTTGQIGLLRSRVRLSMGSRPAVSVTEST